MRTALERWRVSKAVLVFGAVYDDYHLRLHVSRFFSGPVVRFHVFAFMSLSPLFSLGGVPLFSFDDGPILGR